MEVCMKRFSFIFLLMLIVISGCAKKSQIKQSNTTAILHGWVFNVENGNPVKDVKIMLFNEKDTLVINSPTGKFSFQTKPGTYTVSVTKKGFLSEQNKISLTSTKEYKYDIILKKEIPLSPEQKEAQKHLALGIDLFKKGKFVEAKKELMIADSLTPKDNAITHNLTEVNKKISSIVDSLFNEGNALEKKKKFEDAYTVCQSILTYEPDNKNAQEKIDSINKIILAKQQPTPKPYVKTKTKKVNVENIYKQGLALYSKGKYREAIGKFNTVLRYSPSHKGARTYLKKAKVRLKALGG